MITASPLPWRCGHDTASARAPAIRPDNPPDPSCAATEPTIVPLAECGGRGFDNGRCTFGGQQGAYVVYSGISPDGSAHVNKIVSITKGESSWLLVEVTDPNNYEDEKPILQRVENSFTLEVLIPTASLAASRAESFFLHVSGTRQGDFSGVSTRAARKGWSECITYYYAAEGTTFQHMRGKLLLIIGKEIDTASPQLLEAWKSKDILPTVVLEFVRITEEGKEDVFQRIKLTNARVGPVWRFVDLRTRRQGKRERERFEEIGFTWERIESQHKVGSPFWNPDMTGSEPMCRVPKKLKDLCQ